MSKRSYVVRAACTASGPGATVAYQVDDSTPGITAAKRRLTSGEVPCDGTVTVTSASLRVGVTYQIYLTGASGGVARAYAVIVPN